MDKIREDIILFSIIYFVAFSLAIFLAFFHFNYYLEDGPILVFSFTSSFSIPTIYFIRKGKIYATIFALYVLIILWLFYFIQIKGEILVRSGWEGYKGYWIDAWEFTFTLISIGIYYGIKIMVKEYLRYKNLPYEEKKIHKSPKAILHRLSFFILCLLIPIILFLLSYLIKEDKYIYGPESPYDASMHPPILSPLALKILFRKICLTI